MLCVLVCVCSCLHMDKRQTNSISGEGRERERDCRKGRTPSVATNEENRGESNRKRAININPEEEEAIKSKRGNFKKPSFNLSPVSLSLYPSFLPSFCHGHHSGVLAGVADVAVANAACLPGCLAATTMMKRPSLLLQSTHTFTIARFERRASLAL